MQLTAALITIALAGSAAAHGGVLSYNIGGTTYNGFVPYNTPTGQTSIQRQWATYNPITSVTGKFSLLSLPRAAPDALAASTLACNDPGSTTSPQKSATVTAGSKVVAYWNNPWPHTIGPVLVYMANCGGDCTNVSPSSLNWFKINQSGLLSGTLSKGVNMGNDEFGQQ